MQSTPSPYRYNVDPGETVTVAVTAHGTAPLVAAALNFGTLERTEIPGGVAYSFVVTRPAGKRHRLAISCSFPSDADPDARYEFAVSGSAGGHFTNIPHVTPTTNGVSRFRFRVNG